MEPLNATTALPPPLTARDVFRILRRRALLMVTTFALVCGLTLFFTSKMPKVYQASARVYLNGQATTSAPANILGLLGSSGGDALEVEVEKIMAYDFLSRVVARYGDKTLKPEVLRSMLQVTPGPGAQILDVGVKSDDAAKAQKLANIVSEEYIKLVKREYEDRVDLSQERLKQARDKAWGEKVEAEAQLNSFLKDAGISDPSLIYRSQAERTVAVRNALTDAQSDLPLQVARLRDLQGQLRSISSTVYGGIVLKRNPVIDSYKTELFALEVDRKNLLVDYAPDSPEVVAKDATIQAKKEAIAQAIKEPFTKSERSVTRNPDYSVVQSQVYDLERGIASARRNIDTLTRREAELSAAQKTFAVQQSRYESLKRKRDGANEMFEQARSGIVKTETTRGTNLPSLRMLETARLPEAPVSPKPMLNMIMAIALGLMLGVGAALLAEYTASGSMIDDAHLSHALPQVGGVPLLGVLPLALPAPSSHGTDLPVPLASRVGSTLAEDVLREIGFTLAHRHRKEPVPIIVLSSTRSDESTAAVAAQLTATMVRDGMRVTLVDADRATPRLNRVFGAPDAPGLADVLAGRKLVRDILHVGAGGSLRFLAAGSPGDNTPLTESGLRAMFKQLADTRDTDVVIVSGPSVWQVPLVAPLEKAANGLVLLTPAGDGVMGTTPADSVARARRLLSNGYKPNLRGVIVGLDESGTFVAAPTETVSPAILPDSDTTPTV